MEPDPPPHAARARVPANVEYRRKARKRAGTEIGTVVLQRQIGGGLDQICPCRSHIDKTGNQDRERLFINTPPAHPLMVLCVTQIGDG